MRLHANVCLLQFIVLSKVCLAQFPGGHGGFSGTGWWSWSGEGWSGGPPTGGTFTPPSTTTSPADPVDHGSTLATESPTPRPSTVSLTLMTSPSTVTQVSTIQKSPNPLPSSITPTSPISTTLSLPSSSSLNSTDPFTPAQNTSHRLSGGAIAGIVIGSIAGTGFLILAMFLLLRRRRSARTARGRIGQADPFVDTSERGGRERDLPISYESGKEMIEKSRSTPALRNGNTTAPTISPRNGSVRASNTINGSDSASSMFEPGMRSGGDGTEEIIRLFEGRRFEDAILRLISQRMDPPPGLQIQQNGVGPDEVGLGNVAGDGLPAYTRSRDGH